MTTKNAVTICSCELDNGYIFKNFFAVISLRARSVITLKSDKIVAENLTADEKIFAKGYLRGDEINLVWANNIPFDQRNIHLEYETERIIPTLGRIKKKDQARLFITQLQDAHHPDWTGPRSSDDFIIYISSGSGGDGREGLQSIPALRISHITYLTISPNPLESSTLIIPIKSFKPMIDAFTKVKKKQIKLCFYQNITKVDGKDYNGGPGLDLSTNITGENNENATYEKYGYIPNKSPSTEFPISPIDDSVKDYIVHPSSHGQIIFTVQKQSELNEFIFDSDKIIIFSKLASMHGEGAIRISYQPHCHLCIAYRFGAFGEVEIYLCNQHVAVSK